MRRFLSLGVKMTATTVVLVTVVVAIFAALTLQFAREDLERQTERLVRIRTESLDELGRSSARYLAQAAASPMYDNDLGGLYGLVQPLVDDDAGTDAVYAYLVDTDGRVWIAAVDAEYGELHVDGAPSPFYRATADRTAPELAERVDGAFLAPYANRDKLPLREDVTRRLKLRDGTDASLMLQQHTAAVVDRNGASQGTLTIGYSLDRLNDEVAEIRAHGDEKQRSLSRRIALLGGLAVVLGIVIAILQAVAITRNVKALSRAADRIAQGDLSVRARVRSSDEIGTLGHHFNAMADRVQALLHETQEKAKLEKELDIARMIQETLLPTPGLKVVPGLRFAGYFRSASVCGGDFWHHNTLDNGDLLLTVGDVTGHGVPSAMISAAAKSGLDTLINVAQARLALPFLLEELNKTIYDTAQRKFVMTFLALRLDPRTGHLDFANAGHNFPILVRRGADGKTEASALIARGNRLGDDRTSRYQQQETRVIAGDVLFLYTDGLTEYRGPDGAEYGERRLRRLLKQLAHFEPDEILARVLVDLSEFAGVAPQEDDVTLVVVKVQG